MAEAKTTAPAKASVEAEVLPGSPNVFRVAAEHPKLDGERMHVGGVFDTVEDAQQAIDDAKPQGGPSPGGPGEDERARSDPFASALAQGYKLHVERLATKKTGKDDAGQEVAVESEWERVG